MILCFFALVWLLVSLFGDLLVGLILASPFVACGLICLLARKNIGLWCLWAIYTFLDLYFRFATGSAVMFSLIQTAIKNGLDPYKYLTWLLRKAKDADLTDAGTVQSLLPWNAVTKCQTK